MTVLEHDAACIAPAAERIPLESTKKMPSFVHPEARITSTFQCLVVSMSGSRRSMLEHAAQDAGWSTVVCGDVRAAWMAIKRQRFHLAVIDLDGADAVSELRELSQEVTLTSNSLLMLCGNEGNALEEIWARQLGAWLYLPGVTEGNDVSALCAEAKPVAEKLNGMRGTAAFGA